MGFEWQIPTALLLQPVIRYWKRLMPHPVFHGASRKNGWASRKDATQLRVSISLNLGWLWFLHWWDRMDDCRLYVIRHDWGHMGSEPEGICLKWIKDGVALDGLITTLEKKHTYEAIIAVRFDKDAMAYIANENFIESEGKTKKWELPAGRTIPKDDFGRFTFWLEVRSGRKIWRSPNKYEIMVPPLGMDRENFTLDVLDE